MNSLSSQDRQQAHALLDLLPASKLHIIRALLETMVERPVLESLADVPFVESELTAETAEAIIRARASLARGEGISHDDLLQEFGLQP